MVQAWIGEKKKDGAADRDMELRSERPQSDAAEIINDRE